MSPQRDTLERVSIKRESREIERVNRERVSRVERKIE